MKRFLKSAYSEFEIFFDRIGDWVPKTLNTRVHVKKFYALVFFYELSKETFLDNYKCFAEVFDDRFVKNELLDFKPGYIHPRFLARKLLMLVCHEHSKEGNFWCGELSDETSELNYIAFRRKHFPSFYYMEKTLICHLYELFAEKVWEFFYPHSMPDDINRSLLLLNQIDRRSDNTGDEGRDELVNEIMEEFQNIVSRRNDSDEVTVVLKLDLSSTKKEIFGAVDRIIADLLPLERLNDFHRYEKVLESCEIASDAGNKYPFNDWLAWIGVSRVVCYRDSIWHNQKRRYPPHKTMVSSIERAEFVKMHINNMDCEDGHSHADWKIYNNKTEERILKKISNLKDSLFKEQRLYNVCLVKNV